MSRGTASSRRRLRRVILLLAVVGAIGAVREWRFSVSEREFQRRHGA